MIMGIKLKIKLQIRNCMNEKLYFYGLNLSSLLNQFTLKNININNEKNSIKQLNFLLSSKPSNFTHESEFNGKFCNILKQNQKYKMKCEEL